MRWVTRRNAHIDRTGCPWLIRRFIDPAAEFVFVPAETDLADLDGIPFDMRGAALGHRQGRCTFETFLDEYELTHDAALVEMGRILREADVPPSRTRRRESTGIDALITGFQLDIPAQDVNTLFLTNLHLDHTAGLTGFIFGSWYLSRRGKFTAERLPLEVYGPAGSAPMLDSLKEAYREDLADRETTGLPNAGILRPARPPHPSRRHPGEAGVPRHRRDGRTYGAGAAQYIAAFMDIVNWPEVTRRFEAAQIGQLTDPGAGRVNPRPVAS